MALGKTDWQQIETVLLDMDGTLCDLHFENYFWVNYLPEMYAQKNQLSVEQASQFFSGLISQYQGTIHWYCLDFWSDQLNLDIPGLVRSIDHKIELMPHVIAFLQKLRESNKKIILLTNAHPKNLSIKMDRLNIESFFDQLVSTHSFNHPKEQAVFWPLFQRQSGINKSKTLLVDDTVSVLKAAENYGLGYLLQMKKPDSKKPIVSELLFPAIGGFDEVIPYVG